MTQHETIRFHNPTEHRINAVSLGLGFVEPNGYVEVPLALAAPRRTDAGARGASPIECACPQLIVADIAERKAWEDEIPTPGKQESRVATATPRKPEEPPGVAAVRALKAKAAAETAAKALALAVASDPTLLDKK